MNISKIADALLEISAEPIQRRRQAIFADIFADNKEGIQNLISLEIACKFNISINLTKTFSEKDISFSEIFGELFYYILAKDEKGVKSVVKKLPHMYQVIAVYIITNQFTAKLGSDFIYSTIDDIKTLQQLDGTFIKIPNYIDNTSTKDKELIQFSEKESFAFPLYLYKFASKPLREGKLCYYTKLGSKVKTNIHSQLIKEYLKRTITDLEFGGIFAIGNSSEYSRTWLVQPIAISKNSDEIMKLYTGKIEDAYSGNIKFTNINMFNNTSNVIIRKAYPHLVNTLEELSDIPKAVTQKNLILHKFGIFKIKPKVYVHNYKILDYWLDDNFEPIGFILDGNIQIPCTVTDTMLSRGLKDLYISVGEVTFNGGVLDRTFRKFLGSSYGSCAKCGSVVSLKKTGVCYRCSGRLFRWAVESSSATEEVVIHTDVANTSYTGYFYTRKVTFSDGKITFSPCEGCWKGKQGFLPYDFWDKDKGTQTTNFTYFD